MAIASKVGDAAPRLSARGEGQRRLLVATLVLCSFVLGLGGLPLFDLDEGAFAQATLEMLDSGQFAATTLNGEPRFDKPILSYWLQALSVSVLGVSEWAFRLPSALAALGWMFLLWRLVRTHTDTATADVTVLVAATTLGVSLIARAAIADALLNLCIVGAMASVLAYADTSRRRHVVTAFAWMALGTLTKGPVAIVLPLAVSVLLAAKERRWGDWLRAAFDPLAWGVFLLLLTPWLWAVYQAQGAAFFAGFLGEHNLGRFTGTMHGHGGSLFYYVLVLPLVLLPYSGWLLRILPRARTTLLADRWHCFLWSWFAVTFLLFSLSATQLPHYVLYGASPLFALMAMYRAHLKSGGWAFLPAAAFFAVVAVLPWLLPVFAAHGGAYEQALLADLTGVFPLSYCLTVGLAWAMLLLAVFVRRYPLWQRLVLVGCAQALVVTGALLPAVAQVRQVPVQQAASVAAASARPVVAFRTNFPSFSVYYGAPTPRRAPHIGELAFLRIDRLEALRAVVPESVTLQPLFLDGGVALIAINAREGANAARP